MNIFDLQCEASELCAADFKAIDTPESDVFDATYSFTIYFFRPVQEKKKKRKKSGKSKVKRSESASFFLKEVYFEFLR